MEHQTSSQDQTLEAQIKEEAREASLCFETSGDNLASLSLIEKYDRFVHNENSFNDSDDDDDGDDFFPDDTVLREEYAQLTNEASNYPPKLRNNHRISNGLPGRLRKSFGNACRRLSEEAETGNGTTSTDNTSETSDNAGKQQTKVTDAVKFDELIEKLATVRRCEPEGNSILCTDEELTQIQGRYEEILNFFYDKSASFDRKTSSKDSDNEEQVDVGDANQEEQREDMKLLAEKIVSVQQARDKYNDVEQQVREAVEQLELVERYKMESVG